MICSCAILFCCRTLVLANETAADIGAPGIFFKEEKNISIEQEDLYISQEKVQVKYLFKNHSNKDIQTEIAFPIPEYDYDFTVMGSGGHGPDFSDFNVKIDGKDIKYQKEVRALLNGNDVTQILAKLGISIETMGEPGISSGDQTIGNILNENSFHMRFSKLPQKDQQSLINAGLVSKNPEIHIPLWTVAIKYHWSQTFPANRTLSISHSYTPHRGYDTLTKGRPDHVTEVCMTPEDKDWLKQAPDYLHIQFVRYILVTANNWKQPIKKFNLILERTSERDDPSKWRISTCFEKPLTKSGPARYEANISDYIPSEDITVYYIHQ